MLCDPVLLCSGIEKNREENIYTTFFFIFVVLSFFLACESICSGNDFVMRISVTLSFICMWETLLFWFKEKKIILFRYQTYK